MAKLPSNIQKRAIARYIGLIRDLVRLVEQLEKKNYPEFKKLESRLTLLVNQLSGVERQHLALLSLIENILGKQPPPSLPPPPPKRDANILRFTLHPTRRRPRKPLR